jgi:thymidylate synthase (FAD)
MQFKEPEVTIIAATEMDPVRAAAMLIFTKQTRLEMSPGGFEFVVDQCQRNWDWALSELSYMAKTIRSSWEFLDVTFCLMNVSRACAQQITRTRFTEIDGDIFGSYAMQSQRVTDMSGASAHLPSKVVENEDVFDAYSASLDVAMGNYGNLLGLGASKEDARGVLPINLQCNLIAKYNLRQIVDLVAARTSYRAQGEYNDIAHLMQHKVETIWPWSKMFFAPRNEIAKSLISELMEYVAPKTLSGGSMLGEQDKHNIKILIAKVQDQLEGK